jgi:hypothetical protein
MKDVYIQECNSCGAEFPVQYTKGGYNYIGETCDCEDSFSPRWDSPSISEWEQQQSKSQ